MTDPSSDQMRANLLRNQFFLVVDIFHLQNALGGNVVNDLTNEPEFYLTCVWIFTFNQSLNKRQ